MKLNLTIFVSFFSSLFALLGLTCNALPILANFARQYQNNEVISPPISAPTFDIYGKELLSVDGKIFPSSLAYYTESTTLPLSSSSGFLILPNSITSSSLPNSPSRQTVFLDIQGSVVSLDQPLQVNHLSRSATRPTSWFPALRKREDFERSAAVPSKFVRLEGVKPSILPTNYIHYNQINNRSLLKKAIYIKRRDENLEEQQQQAVLKAINVQEEANKEEATRLRKEEEQRVIDGCERFEQKGLLPSGSCLQHLEVQDYADRFVKRDLIETVKKANDTIISKQELSLNVLKDMELRLQADLGQVQKALQLLQIQKEETKRGPLSKNEEVKAKKDNDDDEEGEEDDENDGKAKKEKEEKEKTKKKTRKRKMDMKKKRTRRKKTKKRLKEMKTKDLLEFRW